MAGLAPISLQQRCGIDGRPFPEARAYFYEAETLTPITTYRDYSLGSPHPSPVVADAYGVFPAIFIDEAVEFYRLRITTKTGVGLTDLTTLPVIGPSGGGGGGSEVPVDPDALIKTGYPLWLPRSGTLSGFARMNARTIGSASSGASERANSDCEALFTYYWTNYSDTLCPVTGGRGVSAAADWAANKVIATYDMRGRGPFGLAGMGNSDNSAFSGVTFDVGDSNTAASRAGAARVTLTEAQLPSLTKAVSITDPGHLHAFAQRQQSGVGVLQAGGGAFAGGTSNVNTGSATTGITASVSFGSGQAHTVMNPFVLGTWYAKL